MIAGRTAAALRVLALIVVSILAAGCGGDDATSLADRIRDAAARVTAQGPGSSLTIAYEPSTVPASPYTVVFFPDDPTNESDLVAAGVSKDVAARIYSDLAYLGPLANLLVVEQEGQRLHFTSSWTQVAEAPELLVSKRKTGPTDIVLTAEGSRARIVAVR